MKQLLFAWKVVKHVKSNAIVLVKDNMTIGVGAGQMNRVGAAKIAIEQAGEKAKGSVMSSDAFVRRGARFDGFDASVGPNRHQRVFNEMPPREEVVGGYPAKRRRRIHRRRF